MEEAFWTADEGGDENASNAPDTTHSTPLQAPSQTEHIIYGSPLTMVGGILLFVIIAISLISEARSDGIESRPELFGFGFVAVVLPWYGYIQYRKTAIISWSQDERRVEVFKGIRNRTNEAPCLLTHPSLAIKSSFSPKRPLPMTTIPPTTMIQIRKQNIGWSSKGWTARPSHHQTPPRTPIF